MIRVAVADVSALVAKDSAIDGHARTNTTSVYTEAQIFPMLPLRLSTDLTSLNAGEEALADFCIATVQGAMLIGKIRRNSQPVETTVREALNHLRGFVTAHKSRPQRRSSKTPR